MYELNNEVLLLFMEELHKHFLSFFCADFPGSAGDGNSKKLDVNKENKYPGSPANHDAQILADKVSELHSNLSDTDLEEGEILSESDETAANSPVPPTKRAKLAQPVKNKPSPRTLLNRTSKEKCAAAKETNEAPDASSQSPKSRFKKVCLAASKSNFSTTEDVMETFRLVRAEIRKKYMKLHKTFPKKSFYGVMNNFRESFLEFVDGANFGQLSSQQGELKSKMKKLIVTLFGKLSNNGIVKRIFEQQAGDLKQKLWDFVDVQVEYMLRDIDTTLKSLCKAASSPSDDSRTCGKEKVSRQPPVTKPQRHPKESQSALSNPNRAKHCPVAPYKTGLGSRGKDIRITLVDKDGDVDSCPTDSANAQTTVGLDHPKDAPSTSEKSNTSSLVAAQNGSFLDKTDFELLTEQQASSLTFNLVRDTQMGEIFKCLLQGSDLLESNSTNGDNTAWSLGTPRKDGDRFILSTPTKFDTPSKLFSPSKFDTPSKLIAAWSTISPRKMSSPQSKNQVPLNPALFDESCLLELPSENRALASQRSYSILAEDLAVSLTIPSPLKSDSHLSFLQPSSTRAMSTPDSVISAHISEDALLDGEDATEQDIHLALDTDNSSCGSSSSVASETLATPFMFKPDLPMQALVMERSNDHFIVKIRQATAAADTTITADDSLSKTLTEEGEQHSKDGAVLSDKSHGTPSNAVPAESETAILPTGPGICEAATSDISLAVSENSTLTKEATHKESPRQNTSTVSLSEDSRKVSKSLKILPNIAPSDKAASRPNSISDQSAGQTPHRENMASQQSSPKANFSKSANSPHHTPKSSETNQPNQVPHSQSVEKDGASSDKGLSNAKKEAGSAPESDRKECSKGSKRKKHQEKSKAKRLRKEEEMSTEKDAPSSKSDAECKSTPTSPSSSNLSAKNVIKKKGEVVISWTRSVAASGFHPRYLKDFQET